MRKVIITIEGEAKTGKSTIACMIMQRLNKFGFAGSYTDPDGASMSEVEKTLPSRITTLREQIEIVVVHKRL